MTPVTNGRLLFNSIPTGMRSWHPPFPVILILPPSIYPGYPEPGKTTVYDTTETIDLDTVDLNGGFLIKILELSIDPYMRGRMREATIESYAVSGWLNVQWFGEITLITWSSKPPYLVGES